MLKRTISAIIGVPLLLGIIYLGGTYTALLVAFLALLGLHEFLRLGEAIGIKAWYVLSVFASAVTLFLIFIGGREWMQLASILWLIAVLGKLALQYPKVKLIDVVYNYLAVNYAVVLLSYFYLLRVLPQGLKWTLFIFFVVWATDTGAYLIGRKYGKHSLAPKVSPNKTIEGSLGGLLAGIGVGLLYWRISGDESAAVYLALSILISISGQIGDLFESALKRNAGVKDSGHIIPGHGGILDRFDSFIFAVPLVYYFVSSFIVR